MEPEPPRLDTDRVARLTYEALVSYGASPPDSEAILKRMKGFEAGLPFEDRFIATALWLGRTRFAHKLDQPASASKTVHVYVPDVLLVPLDGPSVVVEVKATELLKLKLRQKDIDGLQTYAEGVGMPVLMAVFWKRLGLWSLTELSAFRKAQVAWHLTFADAMKENLMSVFLGDYMLRLHVGSGVSTKVQVLGSAPTDDDSVEVSGRITDIWMHDAMGARLADKGGLLSLFAHLPVGQEVRMEDDLMTVHHSVTEDQASIWMQQAIGVYAPEDDKGWRAKASARAITTGGARQLRDIASRNFNKGVVHLILDQVPHHMPAWLPRR